MSYIKKHKEGFILTIVFHLLLLLILITTGFFTPFPLPEEQGVLVDFGTSNTGLGKTEPAPRPVQQSEQQPVPEQTTPPPPPQPTPEPETQPDDAAGEELMTQDYEETAAIEEARKKAEEERKKREEEDKIKHELQEKQRLEELEKQRLEQIEQQKLAEAEQRRQDSLKQIELARQAELRRIAELRRQDSIRRAEEEARIAAIDSRAKNVFGNSTGDGDNTSSGQGVTYGSGNQGSPDGTPGVDRYGPGGGEGISFDLTGRSPVNVQKPTYPGKEEGTVVVSITVDKNGRVISATPGVRGSTSLSQPLLDAAKNAALSTRFNEDPNASAIQKGTITYKFVLN